MKTRTIWINAAHLAERITAEMAREFGCSRPRPRPRMMGLAQDKKPRREFDPFKALPPAPAKATMRASGHDATNGNRSEQFGR